MTKPTYSWYTSSRTDLGKAETVLKRNLIISGPFPCQGVWFGWPMSTHRTSLFLRDSTPKKCPGRGNPPFNSKSVPLPGSDQQQTPLPLLVCVSVGRMCWGFCFCFIVVVLFLQFHSPVKSVYLWEKLCKESFLIAMLEFSADNSPLFFPWILSLGSTMGVLCSGAAWHAGYCERRCEQLPIPSVFAL